MSETNRFATIESTMAFLAGKIPPVVAQPPAYPFVGQKAVKRVLVADRDVQVATVAMLYHLQTESEQTKRDTESKNRAGFMSSDAYNGSKIAELLVAGVSPDAIDPELLFNDAGEDRIAKIATKYSGQLAAQLRRIAMIADPILASHARLFSVA